VSSNKIEYQKQTKSVSSIEVNYEFGTFKYSVNYFG